MTTLPDLNRQTAKTAAPYPERVVQFGGGVFIRAFVDWIIQRLNEQADFGSGVVIVKPTPQGSYDSFNQQDGLFHVQIHGLQNGTLVTERTLITCVTRALNPYTDYPAYLALAHQPEIRFIVSNTTETGLNFAPDDKHSDTPASSFPAKLTAFLYERYQHFGGSADKGCIMLPCELIERNGDKLKALILQYADLWGLEAGFKTWIENSNQFCNTLVDRIVVGFPKVNSDAVLEKLGFNDQLLTEGELYHSWVIEAPQSLQDEFPVHKTDLNVKIVDDVEIYRQTKVRILNGAHTSMMPLGYLLGLQTVQQAIEHEWLGNFISDELYNEIIPAFDNPNAELKQFAADVLNRFRNPFIKHHLINIALYSISKFRTRLLPSLLNYHAQFHKLPEHIVYAFAGLVRFYKGEWHGTPIPLNDDATIVTWFQEQWRLAPDTRTLVERVLTNKDLWQQDLSQIDGLIDLLTTYLDTLEKDGIQSAFEQSKG
ncbi:MAG: tagaturonate reductase [Anaerolineaceae bacterium]|nr:tagaturonate reductase [Anaerolineaceae bacterium]